MIKTKGSKLFSFDVEWIPDPLSAHLLYGVKDDPQSYEDAFRVLWEEGGATKENPQPYLKTMLCRIVTIAGILREESKDGQTKLQLISLPEDVKDEPGCNEAALLERFLKYVGKNKPQLVGYNSINADVPIIAQRAIAHGLESHDFAKRPNKPWEGVDYFSDHSDAHVDMAPLLGRYNQTPKLHEAANVCGIPGKMGISGDSVAQMWLAGDLQGIVNYNEYDAFTTHLLWARMAHFSGLLSVEQYEEEQKLVQGLLEDKIAAGAEHLEAYLEEWLRLKKILAGR